MWTDADGRSSIAAEVTKLEKEREFALSPSILPRPARRWAQWGGNSREKEKQPGSGREGRKKGGERERERCGKQNRKKVSGIERVDRTEQNRIKGESGRRLPWAGRRTLARTDP